MANVLANVINAVRDPGHWRSLLTDLGNRIANAQSRVDANEVERCQVTLAAVGGEPKAQRILDRLNADRIGLDLDLANLTRARLEAERHLAEAEAREKADAHWHERTAQRRDLKERVRVAREIESHLRALAEGLGRGRSLAERIRTRHRTLDGSRILVDPLAPEAVASRLAEYLHALGVPDGTLGSEGSAMRCAPESYAETEVVAQHAYDPDRADHQENPS